MFFGIYKHKFSREQKQQIVQAIQAAEKETSGEIHVHLSYAKEETDVLASAKKYFESSKLHENKMRNTVLLYINPSMKKFALYGDALIHEKVGTAYWQNLVRETTHSIRERDLLHGICHAVQQIGTSLKSYFPAKDRTGNLVSDDVTES